MKQYFEKLRDCIAESPLDFGDADSALVLLYDAYAEFHNLDDAQTKADFLALYEAMNGLPLQEMDQIIYPVCGLCRDHQRTGFVEGVKVGVRLGMELAEEEIKR